MRIVFVFALVSLAAGCGARSGPIGPVDAASTDGASADAGSGDAGLRDAGRPRDAAPPARCMGDDDVGAISGFVPSGTFDFPFVVAGVEPSGSHSCPRLFIRAGVDAAFTGDRLEIEVDYEDGDVLPLSRVGRMVVFMGDEVWEEGVPVEITRADGLFDTSLPVESWRASFTISHHDATSDIEGRGDDVPYCTDFAICI